MADQRHPRIDQTEPAVDTVPTEATTDEEEREFHAAHRADRPPTPEEERQAESHGPTDPEVAAHAEEMAARGAAVNGEGQVP
ncbi:MAG: hypothetical protein ACYDA2_00010 [Acidimicrobiales bacterium]